jgi:hypothetical protein
MVTARRASTGRIRPYLSGTSFVLAGILLAA